MKVVVLVVTMLALAAMVDARRVLRRSTVEAVGDKPPTLMAGAARRFHHGLFPPVPKTGVAPQTLWDKTLADAWKAKVLKKYENADARRRKNIEYAHGACTSALDNSLDLATGVMNLDTLRKISAAWVAAIGNSLKRLRDAGENFGEIIARIKAEAVTAEVYNLWFEGNDAQGAPLANPFENDAAVSALLKSAGDKWFKILQDWSYFPDAVMDAYHVDGGKGAMKNNGAQRPSGNCPWNNVCKLVMQGAFERTLYLDWMINEFMNDEKVKPLIEAPPPSVQGEWCTQILDLTLLENKNTHMVENNAAVTQSVIDRLVTETPDLAPVAGTLKASVLEVLASKVASCPWRGVCHRLLNPRPIPGLRPFVAADGTKISALLKATPGKTIPKALQLIKA